MPPVLLPLIATSLAWGQASSTPTSRCADARPGDEIEVCLNEAAKNPDAVSAIASALRAHIDRGTTADRDLLGALLILLDEETGVEGTQRLAALADPRGLQPLIHAAERREVEVAVAAVAAIAAFEHGQVPLTRWLRDENTREEIRLASAEALGQIGSQAAADALIDTLRRPGIDADVRREMYRVIERDYPERLDEIGQQISVNGAPWVTAGATWALGYSMLSAVQLGLSPNAEEGELPTGFLFLPLGAITGGVAGGTAGYLYSRAWPVEAGNAAFVSSSGFTGTVAGYLVGRGLSTSDPQRTAIVGGLGGEVVGYGLGMAFQPLYRGQARDSLEAMGVGAIAGTMAGSAAVFTRGNEASITPEIGAGLATGTAVGHLLAPRIELQTTDVALIGVSSSYGLLSGTLLPTFGKPRRGLPTLGASAGALAGYGLSSAVDPGPDVVAGLITGGVFGGFFGAGVAQVAVPDRPQVARSSALAGSTTGMILGGYFSKNNPDPIDDRDVVLTTMTTSWAAWQTAGWSFFASKPSRISGTTTFSTGGPGLLYVIPAVVGETTAALSGSLDIPVTHSSAALSLGLWGAYAGSATAQLGKVDPLPMALIASNLSLAGGIVVMSPAIGTPPLVVGLADAGGVLGGSTAALGTAIATDNPDTILAASLIGSGLGIAGGAGIGTLWHRGGTGQNIAFQLPRMRSPARVTVAPTQLPGRDALVLGARIGIDEW